MRDAVLGDPEDALEIDREDPLELRVSADVIDRSSTATSP
jgi:hypothetical protein